VVRATIASMKYCTLIKDGWKWSQAMLDLNSSRRKEGTSSSSCCKDQVAFIHWTITFIKHRANGTDSHLPFDPTVEGELLKEGAGVHNFLRHIDRSPAGHIRDIAINDLRPLYLVRRVGGCSLTPGTSRNGVQWNFICDAMTAIISKRSVASQFFHSFILTTALPLRRVADPKYLTEPSLVALLAPHQDGAKQCGRCSHFIWSLDDLWATFPWV